jgi:hypothetical protein
VAKLPLSTPAPNASVAAPEDAIKNIAAGIIAVEFRRETCIVPRAMACQFEADAGGDLLIFERRKQIPRDDNFIWIVR